MANGVGGGETGSLKGANDHEISKPKHSRNGTRDVIHVSLDESQNLEDEGLLQESPMDKSDFERHLPKLHGISGIQVFNSQVSFAQSLPTRTSRVVPDPPVTKASLSELDVPKIIYNPRLRHDVNFDSDLHFRPNVDGHKGKEKDRRAREFWETLQFQLQEFLSDAEAFNTKLAGRTWCLPAILTAVGDILGTLVPPEDRMEVGENLNVELLMQQFSKGVADLEKLAQWLSRTLKTHCAPMRDEIVDRMAAELIDGYTTTDVGCLVDGLRDLLGVLEAMKLDVANHQIRSLRPLLIQDTVEFEQRFFIRRIEGERVNVAAAAKWFRDAQFASGYGQPKRNHSGLRTLVRGFCNLLMPSRLRDLVPDTFVFDEERITKLRAEMFEVVNLEICLRLYRDLNVQNLRPALVSRSTTTASSHTTRSSSPSSMYWTNSHHSPLPEIASSTFASSIRNGSRHFPRSIERDDRTQSLIDLGVTPVSTEVSTQDPSDSPIASSILSSRGNQPPSRWLQDSVHSSRSASTPSIRDEHSLAKALLAILASSPETGSHASRWTSCSQALALQILRSTPAPIEVLPAFEAVLASHLNNQESYLFQIIERSIQADLSIILDALVDRWAGLTTGGLFDVGPGAPALRQGNLLPITNQFRVHGSASISSDNMFEIDATLGVVSSAVRRSVVLPQIYASAKQIAHICILHWRVWGPLVYAEQQDEILTDEPRDTFQDDSSTENINRAALHLGETSSIERSASLHFPARDKGRENAANP